MLYQARVNPPRPGKTRSESCEEPGLQAEGLLDVHAPLHAVVPHRGVADRADHPEPAALPGLDATGGTLVLLEHGPDHGGERSHFRSGRLEELASKAIPLRRAVLLRGGLLLFDSQEHDLGG